MDLAFVQSYNPSQRSILPFPFNAHLPSYAIIQGLWILIPSFPVLKNDPLHSSYARPAPNPNPTHAGHALLLNSKTEKTTPKDRPSDERIKREERQRSHYRAKDISQASSVGLSAMLNTIASDSILNWLYRAYLLVQKSFRNWFARSRGRGRCD